MEAATAAAKAASGMATGARSAARSAAGGGARSRGGRLVRHASLTPAGSSFGIARIRPGTPAASSAAMSEQRRPAGGGELGEWRRLEDEATQVAAALHRARESARVARLRAADRRERGEQARLAGQEAFAVGLLDAAEAHERAAARAEAETGQLTMRHRALRRAADEHQWRLACGRSPHAAEELG